MNTPNNPKTILLVEDSPDDVFFFRRAMSKAGLHASLHIAEDGQQAIQYFSQFKNTPQEAGQLARPDLVLLDLKMPNINGLEVLQWLTEQTSLPPMKVVVLTSSEEPRDIEQSRKLGACGYLTKPISPEQLLRLFAEQGALPFPQTV